MWMAVARKLYAWASWVGAEASESAGAILKKNINSGEKKERKKERKKKRREGKKKKKKKKKKE